MAKADIKAGRAYVELYVNRTAFVKGMESARRQLNSFGDDIMSVGQKMLAAGAAIGAGLSAATARFVSFGSELDDISARTGIASSRLVKLGYAAEQSGSDLSTVESAVKKMSKVISDSQNGSKSASEALGRLGLSASDLLKLKPDEQFAAIAKEIAKIENPTSKAAAAMAIFGKSGTMLLPMIGELESLSNQAESLGIIPLDKDVKAAAALGDAFDRLKSVVLSTLFEIGAAIEPLVRKVVDFATVFGVAMVRVVRENREAILSAVEFFAKLSLLAAGFIAAGIAAKLAAAGVGLLLAILASPAAIITAVAAITTGIFAFREFGDQAKETFNLVAELARAGEIEGAFKVLVASVKVIWLEFTSYIENKWNELQRAITKGVVAFSGMLGFSTDGVITTVDEDFDRRANSLLNELNQAKESLEQVKKEAIAKAQAPGETAAPEVPGAPAAPAASVVEAAKQPALEAMQARSVGSFSAAAFRAESGGIATEMKNQVAAIKKVAAQLIENQRQAHEDMQQQNRIIQQAGTVFA